MLLFIISLPFLPENRSQLPLPKVVHQKIGQCIHKSYSYKLGNRKKDTAFSMSTFSDCVNNCNIPAYRSVVPICRSGVCGWHNSAW